MDLPDAMRLNQLAFLALLAPASTGCQLTKTCTDLGYENGLSVDVRVPAIDAYRVEVEAEGDVLDLTFELDGNAYANCPTGCMAEGKNIHIRESILVSTSNGFGVNITRRGGDNGPRAATVRVYRGDATAIAVEQSFQPHYRTDEPNGDGCGERVFASESMVVP